MSRCRYSRLSKDFPSASVCRPSIRPPGFYFSVGRTCWSARVLRDPLFRRRRASVPMPQDVGSSPIRQNPCEGEFHPLRRTSQIADEFGAASVEKYRFGLAALFVYKIGGCVGKIQKAAPILLVRCRLHFEREAVLY